MDEMEVRLYSHKEHEVELKLYNEMAYKVSLLPGVRDLMPSAEVGQCGDGRTHWLFKFDGPCLQLTAFIDFIKSHNNHYDISSN